MTDRELEAYCYFRLIRYLMRKGDTDTMNKIVAKLDWLRQSHPRAYAVAKDRYDKESGE